MSFLSMRGQTLFVGNLVGEGTGIDFSDGTLQTTAYLGNTSEGIIPNQLTIKNSTNSTEVIISAGQDSSGNLTDNSIYYTGAANVDHNFEGAGVNFNTGVNIDTVLNVGGTTTLNSALNVTGATDLNSTLNVSSLSTLTTAQVNSTLNVSGATTLDSTLTVDGQSNLGTTQIGSTASNSTLLYVDGKISQQMLNGNTALGFSALAAQSSSTSGGQNTAVGYQSLISNTSGYGNTSVGYDTLVSCDAGYGNTAFGTAGLGYVTEGYNNTSIGASAGTSITEGYNNTCLGAGSNITDSANNSTVIGAGVTTAKSNQICLGTSADNTYIQGSLNVDSFCTVTTANVNDNLSVGGTSTFTAGFACGTQTTPYIMLIGTASVSYGGNAIDAYVSDAQNTCITSTCTLNNSMSFPTLIVGGYVNTNYDYIFANFIGAVGSATDQISVSFVNLGQSTDYIPSTISFILWGQ